MSDDEFTDPNPPAPIASLFPITTEVPSLLHLAYPTDYTAPNLKYDHCNYKTNNKCQRVK